MRSVLVVMLLAVSAFAQEAPSAVASACGPKGAWLDVKLDESQHTLEKPEPGKARIYFVQDTGEKLDCIGGARCLTTKIGLDGAWVGANHHNSYFSVSVEPGEHHVCANWQSHASDLNRTVAFAHLSAEAGKVYYFRTRPFGSAGGSMLHEEEVDLDIDPLDSDQAKHLIAVYPLSFSHPKR